MSAHYVTKLGSSALESKGGYSISIREEGYVGRWFQQLERAVGGKATSSSWLCRVIITIYGHT